MTAAQLAALLESPDDHELAADWLVAYEAEVGDASLRGTQREISAILATFCGRSSRPRVYDLNDLGTRFGIGARLGGRAVGGVAAGSGFPGRHGFAVFGRARAGRFSAVHARARVTLDRDHWVA